VFVVHICTNCYSPLFGFYHSKKKGRAEFDIDEEKTLHQLLRFFYDTGTCYFACALAFSFQFKILSRKVILLFEK